MTDWPGLVSHFTAIARGGSVPSWWWPSVLPLACCHVQAVAGPVQDGLDLLLVRALVTAAARRPVGAGGGPRSGLLAVGLHHPTEVGGLVGHVLLIMTDILESSDVRLGCSYQIRF